MCCVPKRMADPLLEEQMQEADSWHHMIIRVRFPFCGGVCLSFLRKSIFTDSLTSFFQPSCDRSGVPQWLSALTLAVVFVIESGGVQTRFSLPVCSLFRSTAVVWPDKVQGSIEEAAFSVRTEA